MTTTTKPSEHFFSDTGTFEFATAFRIDDKLRPGWKMWICGDCATDDDAKDPGKFSGCSLCELCNQPRGLPSAHARANELMEKHFPRAHSKEMLLTKGN